MTAIADRPKNLDEVRARLQQRNNDHQASLQRPSRFSPPSTYSAPRISQHIPLNQLSSTIARDNTARAARMQEKDQGQEIEDYARTEILRNCDMVGEMLQKLGKKYPHEDLSAVDMFHVAVSEFLKLQAAAAAASNAAPDRVSALQAARASCREAIECLDRMRSGT